MTTNHLSLLRDATIAARERTGDVTIGTRVQNGRIQLVRVTYPSGKRGASTVIPASGWLAPADAIARLDAWYGQ